VRDTSEEVRRRFRAMLLSRCPADRLDMGLDMFDSARSLVRAGILAAGGEVTREALLRKTYAGDLAPEELERIAAHLRGPAAAGGGARSAPTSP
jgi:hypothetical protein